MSKIYCKCGHCLTKTVVKTPRKEAFTTSPDNDPYFDTKLTPGTYFRWKYIGQWYRKHPRPSVYTINYKDLVDGCITETFKGCCNWDEFTIQCPACKIVLGGGGNDCWQIDSADLICTKVKIGN